MSVSRRSFIHNSIAAGTLFPLFSMNFKKESHNLRERNKDENYWKKVADMYHQNVKFINLESGYFSPSPESVKDYWVNFVNEINESPSYYMRTRQTEMREKVREKLASYAGIQTDELVLTRNTTESMNIIIQGIKLDKGDEILRTNLEYPNIIQALDMRERRFGTKVRIVDVPIHPRSQQEIVNKVIGAVNKKTKVILISHMVFLNGQVFPVKEVCAKAREMGLETIVDGAHSFSHVDMDVSEIGCDYYASSLHKWLGAPLGNGLLYVKKGNAERLWPLYGDTAYDDDNIMKLEHLGTRPCSDQNGIIPAVDFNLEIGKKEKSKRLKFLQMRWASELKDNKNIILNTPLEEGQSFGIANVGVKNLHPSELADKLFDNHNIFTVPIDDERGIRGVRVSPNLYSTIEDIDKFIEAMLRIAA
ncbi:MAG: aminotransferase class V-fold PLP-dependent enzyme [Flammeovirgaceae bacterium]